MKTTKLLITSVLTFLLLGCGNNTTENNLTINDKSLSTLNINNRKADNIKLLLLKDKDKLSLPHYVIKSLSLPSKGENNSTISWSSNKKRFINDNGTVTRPSIDESDANVTLTATLKLKNLSETKEFMLTVLKQSNNIDELMSQEWKVIQATVPKISFYSLSLPLVGINGSSITWISNSPEIVSDDGKILGELTEDKNISFTVILEQNGKKKIEKLPIALKIIK